MGEHLTPAFSKMIRISVAEGLKRAYKEYRLSKWLKVQEMAATVRRVLDAETGAYMPPMGHQVGVHPHPALQGALPGDITSGQHGGPAAPTPGTMASMYPHIVPPATLGPLQHSSHGQGHHQGNIWVGQAEEPVLWQTAASEGLASDFPGFPAGLPLVSPISSPRSHQASSTPVDSLPGHHGHYLSHQEVAIRRVENSAVTRQLFNTPLEAITDSEHVHIDLLIACAPNLSTLSNSSDEILDSVNVVNPHNHGAGDIDNESVSYSRVHPQPHSDQRPVPPMAPSVTPAPYHPAPPAIQSQPPPHPGHLNVPTQASSGPHHDQVYTNYPAAMYEDGMDWDGEEGDWDEDDYDDMSSYNSSEDSLAGVLFATQGLLPEQQAVRLDVEMGDMGVGHILFDRVNAAWYTAHCEFYRADWQWHVQTEYLTVWPLVLVTDCLIPL